MKLNLCKRFANCVACTAGTIENIYSYCYISIIASGKRAIGARTGYIVFSGGNNNILVAAGD